MGVRVRVDEAGDQSVSTALDHHMAGAGLTASAAHGSDLILINLDPAIECRLTYRRNDQHIADEPAHGISSLCSPRVALMERMNSMMRRSVALSPRVVLVTIGNNEMIEQIMIFGAIPKPNQMVSSGMMAMIGMALDTMT